MNFRSTCDTIEELRQLLKDLEQPHSDCDPVALDDLKQIVRHRISALEATEELEAHGTWVV